MQYINLDKTDIQVSRLAFGTASLHRVYSKKIRQNLLHAAFDFGFTHFDTSPYYGYGLAEVDLGNFARTNRSKVTLASKVGLYPRGVSQTHVAGVWARKALGKLVPAVSQPTANWSIEAAKNSLSMSLKRLSTDYLDILFLHEPHLLLLSTDSWLEWLIKEQQFGRIRHWGIAGLANSISTFVKIKHPLAAIIQTKDSLQKQEANFLAQSGRDFQFTYGYLSEYRESCAPLSVEDTLQAVLTRNRNGSVVVSSRSPKHIAALASVAQ